MDVAELERTIVAAKSASYVGGGGSAAPSRTGSHDLRWQNARWSYLDSYLGGTDFHGQEVVWHDEVPVWAMSYYGAVLRPELIDGARAGLVITAALKAMYSEGRFLGGFELATEHGTYVDSSRGDVTRFHGREVIRVEGAEAYALDYFGGLVIP